jgi:hypothetical protein
MSATDAVHSALTRGELEALRELAGGSVRRRIGSGDAARLVALGLARETADGVTITQLGRALLATRSRADSGVSKV